ncbi:hypothetical protein ACTXT7_016098 [Hymenolepis weldensis]
MEGKKQDSLIPLFTFGDSGLCVMSKRHERYESTFNNFRRLSYTALMRYSSMCLDFGVLAHVCLLPLPLTNTIDNIIFQIGSITHLHSYEHDSDCLISGALSIVLPSDMRDRLHELEYGLSLRDALFPAPEIPGHLQYLVPDAWAKVSEVKATLTEVEILLGAAAYCIHSATAMFNSVDSSIFSDRDFAVEMASLARFYSSFKHQVVHYLTFKVRFVISKFSKAHFSLFDSWASG